LSALLGCSRLCHATEHSIPRRAYWRTFPLGRGKRSHVAAPLWLNHLAFSLRLLFYLTLHFVACPFVLGLMVLKSARFGVGRTAWQSSAVGFCPIKNHLVPSFPFESLCQAGVTAQPFRSGFVLGELVRLPRVEITWFAQSGPD